MTSPHSPYPHPGHGPGPSSYYHQSPQTSQHVYGGHSPGPSPNYSYPYPPPGPHMNSHHPGVHQQVPQRANGRGGSYSSRGGHSHYNYYPPQHHSYSHPSSIALQAPHPHPYAPHPTKYNPPFSPPYVYPNPAAIPYIPQRHTPQSMSPLPKQLSMPPPNVTPTTYYDPTPGPIPAGLSQVSQLSPTQSPAVTQFSPAVESSPSLPNTTPVPDPSSEKTAFDSQSSASSSPQIQLSLSSSYAKMGTINTDDPGSPSEAANSPKATSSPTPDSPLRSAVWAVWSRRPQDPSHAPGIIISPRARPPPNIVEQALDVRTPPVSPSPSPVVAKRVLPVVALGIEAVQHQTEDIQRKGEDDAASVPQAHETPNGESTLAELSSQTNSTVPSSAVTETTDTPTVPGSPVSTNTSVSVSGTPSKDNKELSEVTESRSTALDGSELDSATPTVTESSVRVPSAPPTQDVIASSSTTTVLPEPTPAPVFKKTWASLLQTASPSGPSTPSKNALPTSLVVGFSIPASVSQSAAPVPVSPSKKTELINLLTHNPTTTALNSKIRPRGLVNSGNMCFANSVLQILVYCAPFHRLFLELGKVLPGKAGATGKDGDKSSPTSATPLVDATTVFLKEFLEEKKGKQQSREVNGRVNGSGTAGAGYGRGKGKEKEKEEVEDDDWDGDSFLPTYIYDAMKEKKRFDHMRGGHQEDAEEFLGFYLDTLEEELLSLLNSVNPAKPNKPEVEEKEEAAPPEDDGWLEVGKKNRTVVTRTTKATESPITRIFGGKFRSTLRAPRQKDSVVVEDWRSLRLDIQREQIRTIQDALSYISHPQPVQVTHPSQPGIAVEATQQVLIEALPPVLVLHIKRFCYDTNVKGVVKVGKQVLFGPELEVGPDLMAPLARKVQGTRYKLFGALYHHGLSASGGHYTLDVLHPSRYPSTNLNAKPREGWVRIDDDLVSDVRSDDVFGASERDDSRCAYLLFYRRIW